MIKKMNVVSQTCMLHVMVKLALNLAPHVLVTFSQLTSHDHINKDSLQSVRFRTNRIGSFRICDQNKYISLGENL